MGTLLNFLQDMRAELLEEGDDAILDPESIVLAIEGELGLGSKLLALDDAELQGCDPGLLRLHRALGNAQEHWDLYATIACDGLCSIFYNGTGDAIDRMRTVFSSFGSPLSPLLARACELAVPMYEISPDSSWVSRNPGADPRAILGQDVHEALERLETAMADIQDAAFELALDACRAAAAGCRERP